MNKTNLPNNLYELRRKAGLSQEEFADRLNVSRQAVSKWERGEAYPDTENLITISEMFKVTIDELLNARDLSSSEAKNIDAPDVNEHANITDEAKPKGGYGLKLELDNGINIKLGKGDESDFIDEDDDDSAVAERSNWKYSMLYSVPYSIACLVAFLVLGFTLNAWYWAWTLFITVPVYDSVLDAIRKKSLSEFEYAILVAFIYCLFGIIYKWWHPGWVIFVTIPVFYTVAEAIDKHISKKNDTNE